MTMTASSPSPTSARPDPTSLQRWGAAGLLIGGPLSLAFHVLWVLGHGTTVVNEHGVVLGLTNDQWSHLGLLWSAPLALGVLAVCALHDGRLTRAARALVPAGLLLGWAATSVFALYSLGLLVLFTGVLCLGLVVLRGGVLPRWAGHGLLVSVAAFVPMVVVPGPVVDGSADVLGVVVGGQDVIVLVAAAAWTGLGVALARTSRRPSNRSS